ncbi:MAG: outer membrane beta-barrel protein [marine benthic group bacterium]|nr:outer membrane beta-barrel protein [Gemmatimonadota bacterium]MCL7961955.1 outer membrane beta-barrel protein [Candidatus Carthagonibacter metallireducens]MCL7937719.1 outer membrane beta-barrel protein [Gemmatimonadota bacterium]MCL7956930.1 outer membrane beta-barrel protein [Gemmatimonadota bacterium]MCL7964086.1 outer membrane beta-barrel protein [Gemmatimonadota bacterium]
MNPTRLPARLVVAICGLMVLFAPSSASAQEERIDSSYRWIDRSMRAGPYAGYIFTSRGNLDQAPGSSPVVGGRFRVRISSPLTFEVSLGYGSSDLYVTDPRLDTPAIVDTTNSDWLLAEVYVQLALTGSRSVKRVQPYLLFGGGIIQGLSEEVADIYAAPGLELYRFKIGTTPSIGVGVGVEWDISDRLGLGAEFRDHIWRFKSPEAFFFLPNLANFLDSGVEAPEESFWTNNLELSATLSYYF